MPLMSSVAGNNKQPETFLHVSLGRELSDFVIGTSP